MIKYPNKSILKEKGLTLGVHGTVHHGEVKASGARSSWSHQVHKWMLVLSSISLFYIIPNIPAEGMVPPQWTGLLPQLAQLKQSPKGMLRGSSVKSQFSTGVHTVNCLGTTPLCGICGFAHLCLPVVIVFLLEVKSSVLLWL